MTVITAQTGRLDCYVAMPAPGDFRLVNVRQLTDWPFWEWDILGQCSSCGAELMCRLQSPGQPSRETLEESLHLLFVIHVRFRHANGA